MLFINVGFLCKLMFYCIKYIKFTNSFFWIIVGIICAFNCTSLGSLGFYLHMVKAGIGRLKLKIKKQEEITEHLLHVCTWEYLSALNMFNLHFLLIKITITELWWWRRLIVYLSLNLVNRLVLFVHMSVKIYTKGKCVTIKQSKWWQTVFEKENN